MITQQIADKWTGEPCHILLHGRVVAAKIAGRLLPTARIQTIGSPIVSIEYAWPTVDRVMTGDKLFTM